MFSGRSTLIVDLDARIAAATRPDFRGSRTVAEHWRKNDFNWWRAALMENPSYDEQEQAIKGWLSHWEFNRILELGPGTGRITRILQPICTNRLTLVEINKKFLQQLSQGFPEAQILNGDVTKLTWHHEGPYNLIVAVEILVHIPDVIQLMVKIHQALTRPAAQAIVSITPLTWYEANYKGTPTVHRGIDRGEFEQLLSALFRTRAVHESTSGQHVSYWLEKK